MARLAHVAIVILGASAAIGLQGTARADLPGPGDEAGPPGSTSGTPGTQPGATTSARKLRLVPSVPGEPLREGDAIRVAVGSVVTVRFPGAVHSAETAKSTRTAKPARPAPQLVSAAVAADTVAIVTLPGVRSGTATTLDVRGEFAPFVLPIQIIEAKPGVPVPTQWRVEPNGDVEARERQQAEEAARIEADAKAEHERETRRREDTARTDSRLDTVAQVARKRFDPEPTRQLDPGGPLKIRVGLGTWVDGECPFGIRIVSASNRPIELASARVTGADGNAYRPDYKLGSARRGELVTIEPGGVLDGAVTILPPQDADGPVAPFTLELFGPDGTRVAGVEVPHITEREWDYIRLRDEEAERLRAARAERERLREAQRVSLHVTGSYGAILFPSGVSGIDGTEAASLTGLGVRLTKGLLTRIAFEAEIGGATSGVATFDDVTVDDTMGDLTRSAKLGRVSLGGVLRFGDKIVPHARLGVGLQLVDEVTMLQTGGGPVQMDGSGLAFGGSVYGGAGVDFKLGENLVAGLGLTFTAAQSDQRMLDVWLSVAYRWDPSSK